MNQVHLTQQFLSLADELKSQQQAGEMTDTLLVCEEGERITAHCVVLATHWVWGYLVRGLDWRGEELNIVMEGFTRREVEEWVNEAYTNIDTSDNPKWKCEVVMSEMKDIVKVEKELEVENQLEDSEYVDDESDQIDAKIVSDDSLVNIAEHFDLVKLVKEQIMLNNGVEIPMDHKRPMGHSRKMKDHLFKVCVEALEKTVENCPSKVRGLPLHGFVYTDDKILEDTKVHVKRDKIDVKLPEGRGNTVTSYFCTFDRGCDFSSEERQNVIKHVMDYHTELGAFMCKGCGKRFTIKDRAYRHIQTEHVIKHIKSLLKDNFKADLSCHICGLFYKKEAGLREHIKNLHEKERDWQCQECSFVTKDYLEIRKHKKDEHGHGHRACHVCGKQFTSQVGFDHHVENTHGEGSFPCEDCGDIYKTTRALTDHRKRKHLARTCVCDECGAKFHTPFEVKKHKRTHSTEFPFPCNLCNKRFRDPAPLKEHMYKHTGERPYQCKVCEATFNQSNALSRHTRVVHSGIRPYPCELCNFRGGQAYDLVRHMKTVHQMNSAVDY